MTQKNIKLVFTVLLFALFFKSKCLPYDNEYVHQSINENASFQLYSALRNLGFTGGNGKVLLENNIIYGRTMKFWFHEGARLEDETICRSRNHFHDPLKSVGYRQEFEINAGEFPLPTYDYTQGAAIGIHKVK